MSGTEPIVVVGGVLDGRPVELLLDRGRIAGFGRPSRGEVTVVDVGGATLLPGLHDHHLHLRAWAAAVDSVPAGPPEVADTEGLVAALAAAPVADGGWIRAVGYHQSVAGALDRRVLDRLGPDRPIRVQHRSGGLWILNSKALEAIGLGDERAMPPDVPDGVDRDGAGRPTGLLWRCDDWLGERVPRPPTAEGRLGEISRMAAARGVTGFTDATPGRDAGELDAFMDVAERGVIGQRLHLMAPVAVANAVVARWPRAETPGAPPVTLGPHKVVLDDDRLPGVEDLARDIAAIHRAGRPVAVHCVTRVQAVVTLAAFEAAKTVRGDRLEHGAILDATQIQQLRDLALTVVTQPGFVATRGDRYLADVDPADQGDLWRLRSLLDGGVSLAAGSDAPFGPYDPWTSVEAAVTRRAAGGAVLGAAERLERQQAVALWTGRPDAPGIPRRLALGEPADLCAVDLGGTKARGVDSAGVVLAVAAGRILHCRS